MKTIMNWYFRFQYANDSTISLKFIFNWLHIVHLDQSTLEIRLEAKKNLNVIFTETVCWRASARTAWWRSRTSGWRATSTGRTTTARAARPCCPSSGCRQKPSLMESSRQKRMSGTWGKYNTGGQYSHRVLANPSQWQTSTLILPAAASRSPAAELAEPVGTIIQPSQSKYPNI